MASEHVRGVALLGPRFSVGLGPEEASGAEATFR